MCRRSSATAQWLKAISLVGRSSDAMSATRDRLECGMCFARRIAGANERLCHAFYRAATCFVPKTVGRDILGLIPSCCKCSVFLSEPVAG